jgi:hypothetical protein
LQGRGGTWLASRDFKLTAVILNALSENPFGTVCARSVTAGMAPDGSEAPPPLRGTAKDIFQGDIFRSLDVMIPRPSGDYRDYEPFPVIVVAHDCEWTKYRQSGSAPDYKFGIAPLRRLSSFEDKEKPGLLGTIENNRVRYLFPLPHDAPLDDTYVVDLRLIQPITVAALLEQDLDRDLWTSIGDGIKTPLQAKLTVFFANLELVRAEK